MRLLNHKKEMILLLLLLLLLFMEGCGTAHMQKLIASSQFQYFQENSYANHQSSDINDRKLIFVQ